MCEKLSSSTANGPCELHRCVSTIVEGWKSHRTCQKLVKYWRRDLKGSFFFLGTTTTTTREENTVCTKKKEKYYFQQTYIYRSLMNRSSRVIYVCRW